MHAVAHAQANTCATSLMRVKNRKHHLFLTLVFDNCLGHWNEENERTKTSDLIVDHFSLTFAKHFLA